MTLPDSLTRPLLALLALAAAGCGADRDPASLPIDVLIVGGTVYDGSAEPPRQANVAIRDGLIVDSDAPADAPADRVVDAKGLVVMPGFIDPHTHAGGDLAEPARAANRHYLAQGVTTVFIGNDGDGVPGRAAALQAMREHGVGTNVAFFAGHNDIRERVMGLENRPPAAGELERMRTLVDAEMRAGALGLSTGLYYTPGSFADTDEIVSLARVVANYGGVYDSHLRDEASYSIGLLASVEEAIAIGEAAGVPVHIAHLKALGRDAWGLSGEVIALIDAARRGGLDVTADQYPYRASGTRFSAALIPAWVRADSAEAMASRLKNADLQDRILEAMADNLRRRGGADAMLVTASDSPWRGMTLAEIAAATGHDPLQAAIDAVLSGDPSIASFNMHPDDIEAFAVQDWMMTGSDGSAGHPRKYATYPKAWGDLVAGGLMPAERFAHRSAGAVADFYGLCDRGYVRSGYRADVVVIDVDTYRPQADFERPERLATGVVHAFVNGRAAILDGTPTGERPGEIIDARRLDCSRD